MDGLEADPDRNDDEGRRVDESRQHTRALVAEGLGVGSWPRLEIDGGKAEQQGQEVRSVVASFRKQPQRVGAQAEYESDDDVSKRGHQREAEHGLGATGSGRRCVDMHGNSIPGVGIGRNAPAQPKLLFKQ